MAERGGAGPDDSDDLAAQLSALGTKLDRVTYLLVALLALEVFHVFGESLVQLSLLALLALVAGFVFLVALGLARSL